MTTKDTHGDRHEPEIAVDLDGTLAHYDGWKGIEHIGEPIPAMMDRVKQWIAEGKKVTIFTARVSGSNNEAIDATHHVKNWLIKHGLGICDITCVKRMQFVEMWDDRCVTVIKNEGKTLAEVLQ